jgi:hypothetical protein
MEGKGKGKEIKTRQVGTGVTKPNNQDIIE